MTSQLDVLLSELYRPIEEKRAIAKDRLSRVLTTAFAELPKLNFIRLRGYTPAFNDGDPCEHSQSVLVDNYSPDYLFESLEEDDEEFERIKPLMSSPEEFQWRESVWNRETNTRENVPFPTDPHQAGIIKTARLLNSIEDDINVLFNTNWTIDIIRDASQPEGYRFEHNDYDCGF